jgi:rhodanese-related sulfurtransferase
MAGVKNVMHAIVIQVADSALHSPELKHQNERSLSMKNLKTLLAVVLGLATSIAFAQQGAAVSNAAVPGATAPGADVWKYNSKRLTSAEVDALLAKPEKLVVIDVRRPDELTAKGSFPVYLNIQTKDIEKSLAYIPKDRAIITVSNHAHRAGAVGDLLTSKGFKVAGAAGSEDYEAQGGKAVVKVIAPPPKVAQQ